MSTYFEGVMGSGPSPPMPILKYAEHLLSSPTNFSKNHWSLSVNKYYNFNRPQ